MASGNTLLELLPQGASFPAANYMTFDTRNVHLVLDADATTDETVYWEAFLPAHYAGGGLTCNIAWMATSATTGTARFEAAIERHDDEVTDLDADSFATANSAGGAAPATSGAVEYTAITFTNGAQMDSLAVGEHFRFLLRRDADGTTGTDDMTGDAEILGVYVTET